MWGFCLKLDQKEAGNNMPSDNVEWFCLLGGWITETLHTKAVYDLGEGEQREGGMEKGKEEKK